MSYATLAALKAVLKLTETTFDTELQQALDTASGVIDGYCQRSFVVGATMTKTFDAPDSEWLFVTDLQVVTALTWYGLPCSLLGAVGPQAPGGAYELVLGTSGIYRALRRWVGDSPAYWNANPPSLPDGQTPEPYSQISVVGTWGIPLYPPVVSQACEWIAAKIWNLRDTEYSGKGGNSAMGMINMDDVLLTQGIKDLLNPVVYHPIPVIIGPEAP